MVEQTSFLGMKLNTQRQRRVLVILYYAVLLTLAVVGLCVGKKTWGPLAAQTLVLGGLLGGIRMGGPVKVYAQPHFPLDMDSTVHTLNLAGRRPFDTSTPETWVPLDERERMQRDAAHYIAYRIVRWGFGGFVFAYFLASARVPLWLADRSLFLLWVMLLLVLSLPQSVVLWTEPEEPAGELVEMRAGSR